MHRRLQLINWVKEQHQGQLIKDTEAPYFDHLLTVANNVAAAAPLTYEIGLCHDLFEKTEIVSSNLQAQLQSFNYSREEAEHISNCVTELTRHFTKADNPLPKKERKALEDERLIQISTDAQTVKYADFSYNGNWMIEHDPHHAADYLKRHINLIKEMTAGDTELRNQVVAQFRQLLTTL